MNGDPAVSIAAIAHKSPLSSESVPLPEGANGTDSPSSVREHERLLTERWAHLAKEFPKAVQTEQAATVYRKALATEMGEIRRLLQAHKRLRTPVQRKKRA
jgi:hypothetical protein